MEKAGGQDPELAAKLHAQVALKIKTQKPHGTFIDQTRKK
jgi:hypothetical protein